MEKLLTNKVQTAIISTLLTVSTALIIYIYSSGESRNVRDHQEIKVSVGETAKKLDTMMPRKDVETCLAELRRDMMDIRTRMVSLELKVVEITKRPL